MTPELILEIGTADGDLPYAIDCVQAAAELGADWVKGQLLLPDRLATRDAQSYAQEGATRSQREMFGPQLDLNQWEEVARACKDYGVGFFASVWDFRAIRFCELIGVERYKIGSGDITYEALVRHVGSLGKLVLLSTGASTAGEIEQAVSWLKSPFGLMACSLSYPTRAVDANLRRMESLRRWTDDVGYSDHTRGPGAMVRAAYLGATRIEKHFTLRPGTGGDHAFAITADELRLYQASASEGSPIYDGSPILEPFDAEQRARIGARRSLVAGRDYKPGDRLNDVQVLRPGTGIEPYRISEFAMRRLAVDVAEGTTLTEGMFV